MPRGGSKKGEHRGNAKPRTGLETPNELMRQTVRRVGAPSKTKLGIPHVSVVEEQILASQMVHGRQSVADLTPKEIVLNNMHHFYQAALTSKAMARMLMVAMPEGEARSREIARLEYDEERLRRISSDEAYKVMPFVHPRLAAIAHLGDMGSEDDIVQAMLDEVDRRNREHPLTIEHMPQKRTA